MKPSLLVFCWTRSQPSQAQVMSVTNCVMFTRRRNLVTSRLSLDASQMRSYFSRLSRANHPEDCWTPSSGHLHLCLGCSVRWHPLTCCFQSSGAVQQYKRVRCPTFASSPPRSDMIWPAEILDLLSISISMPVTAGICFHPKSIATSWIRAEHYCWYLLIEVFSVAIPLTLMLFLIFVIFSHISTVHEAHFHAIQQILTPWRPASFVSEHGGTGIDGPGVSCGTSQFFLDPLQNDQISMSPIDLFQDVCRFYVILWYSMPVDMNDMD